MNDASQIPVAGAADDAQAQVHLAAQLDAEHRHEEAVAVLRRGAALGHARAATVLGTRLLVGRDAPFAPREGVTLISDAAQAGDAGALAHLATLTAAGLLVAQSWSGAAELLAQASARGSTWAQSQLLVLAADRPLAESIRAGAAGGPQSWEALRASIDFAGWLHPPARQSACEAPRIRIAEAFAPPEVCAWLIDQGRGKFQPSRMYDGRRANFTAERTCSDFVFDLVQAGVVLVLVRARASALMKLPVPFMEPTQIFHYALGEEIKAHFDHVRLQGADAGERIATLLLYLNDDYDGGHLEFPKVGFKYRGRTGDAVFFASVDLAGKPDPTSLHGAHPVTRGEKWILSQWVQDRPFGAGA